MKADRDEQLRALSPAKRALFEQLSGQKPRGPEPIAIIGMGCRFPGEVTNPASYWSLLREGKCAVREIPSTRWDAASLYDPDPDAPGKTVSRWGGFLSSVEWFDADLFGITPRQAVHMDPQHRLLLEVAFEALEDAALPPLDLAGVRGGVYVGISFPEYTFLQMGRLELIEALTAPGIGLHSAAGRLSHAFGLEGPSMAVDTACSSSLVAVHLACQALRHSEVDLALAAGVNLMLSPLGSVALSKLRLLSPDGQIRPFDAGANGYVRGEGGGVLVLKRLSDATMDGDRVLAVIRGSAVNQDGRASGYAVPNGYSQRAVLKAALENAGIASGDVGYVEAQGTGTPIGDAVEADALADVFGRSRTAEHPLMVGAVKANLGHLESAAGMASIIKAVLALRHGEVPRNLHLQSLHPDILQRKAPLLFPQEHTPWPRGPRPRVAGVSAFGVAGTNAHIVLSEAPDAPAPTPPAQGRHTLVVLSGQTDQAAWDHALQLHGALNQDPNASLRDLALTSTAGRSHLPSRVAVCASTTAELEQRLNEFLWGRTTAGLFTGRAPTNPARVGFVFSGEAAELTSAGRMLYERRPAFRTALDRLSSVAQPWTGVPVSQILWGGPAHAPWPSEALAAARLALELALHELWKSVGMIPDFVAGYGAGEYAAACVAGVMSPEDALHLVAERARLWDEHVPDRAALRVHAPADRVAPILGDGGLLITADEGNACVVAGRVRALESLVRAMREELFSVSPCAGPYVATADRGAMGEAIERLAAQVKLRPPLLRLFSGASGAEIPTGVVPGGSYWEEHARGPVRLMAMIKAMEQQGCEIFLEIGSDSPLSRNPLGNTRTIWVPSLARGRDDDEVFLCAMANLFVRGAVVDVRALGRPTATRASAPPTYPFQRKRYWLDLKPASGNGVAAVVTRRNVVQELAAVSEPDRLPHLHRYVASEVARVLGWESTAALREDVLLSEVGLDSILAVDLLSGLRRDLNLELPATLLYDHPTLGTLVGYLDRGLVEVVTAASAAAPPER